MSLSLDTSEQTLPDVLGALLLSPRADRLEGEFCIEDEAELKNVKLLNSAGLSHFFVAEYKGRKVLQKVIKYRNIDDKVLASFEKEVAVLSTLSHANIVTFIGAKATPPDLFMLLEWMAQGSLSSILLNDLSLEISWTRRMKWAQDVARGIEYLHLLRPKIIHRDLRSDNVMVNGEGVAKVSEFGLSRRKRFQMKSSPRSSLEVSETHPPIVSSSQEKSHEKSHEKGKEESALSYVFVSEGGPSFTPPELLLSKSYSEKVDSYNFGIMVWQIVARQIPHRGKSSIEIADAVVQHSLRPLIPDYVPDELKSLIQNCWRQEESERLSFEEIVPKLEEISQANFEPDLPTEDIESASQSESSRHDSLSLDQAENKHAVAAATNSTTEFNEFL